MNRFQNLDVDQALRLIIEGTAAETGNDFYAALVKTLAAIDLSRGGKEALKHIGQRRHVPSYRSIQKPVTIVT